MELPAGKLPPYLLRTMLASLPPPDPSVIIGAAVGEDAAVIDTGGPELLVAKTDPITFATEDVGRYLLAVNGNDLATMGAEPRWLLVTALLPEGVSPEGVAGMFDSLKGAAAEFGVVLVGGHTEMTVDLDRPILVGCLLGMVDRDKLVRTAGARPGDAILLVGGVAIEGTAILCMEHADRLRAKGVKRTILKRAATWLRNPGISVLPAARAISATGAVHAMHDPTEGGLMTALHELAEAAQVGLRIDGNAITVLPECRTICNALGLDPLGLLASGALLVTLDPDEVAGAVDRLCGQGISAARIGEVVAVESGRTLVRGDQAEPLPTFARDELARFLESQ